MNINFSAGKIKSAKKIVLYGPEGVGKSTFASKFPSPLFIDTEGSTKNLDVLRTGETGPESWSALIGQVNYVIENPTVCRTLVIDTFDWAERLCIDHICAKANKKGIEDFGYGNGYVYEKEEIERFLTLLDRVISKDIHVVLTAHAHIRKFEQPDELGAYDRWELKLGKKTGSQISPLIKEWADMVLFANYKTVSVATDDKGTKFKAQGNKRVMYTTHHPCWDAKNREGLPDEVEFDYNSIAHCIPNFEPNKSDYSKKDEIIIQLEEITDENNAAPFIPETQTNNQIDLSNDEPLPFESDEPDVPPALLELMQVNNVTERDIQTAVAQRGYFPIDTPIINYGEDFINGCLIAGWEQVLSLIKNNK